MKSRASGSAGAIGNAYAADSESYWVWHSYWYCRATVFFDYHTRIQNELDGVTETHISACVRVRDSE